MIAHDRFPNVTPQTAQIPFPGTNLPVLDEADVVRLLTEALTADVEAVLADQTGLVGADAAAAGALAVGTGTGEVDGLVGHGCELSVSKDGGV